MSKAQTTIRHEAGGTVVTRLSDGYEAVLRDVGRCYRLSHRPAGKDAQWSFVDISHNTGAFDAVVRMVRRWLREDDLPICDVHA